MTIYWINGPFGVGKTSTAAELLAMLPGATLYDPEEVGTMLRKLLPHQADGDFQDLPPWRPLVAATAVQLLGAANGPLVTPMTLLRRSYAEEIFNALAGSGVSVHHILLHAEDDVLRARIERHDIFPDDPARSDRVRAWRLRHLAAYRDAMGWLASGARMLDTTTLSPEQAATRILEVTEPAGPAVLHL